MKTCFYAICGLIVVAWATNLCLTSSPNRPSLALDYSRSDDHQDQISSASAHESQAKAFADALRMVRAEEAQRAHVAALAKQKKVREEAYRLYRHIAKELQQDEEKNEAERAAGGRDAERSANLGRLLYLSFRRDQWRQVDDYIRRYNEKAGEEYQVPTIECPIREAR